MTDVAVTDYDPEELAAGKIRLADAPGLYCYMNKPQAIDVKPTPQSLAAQLADPKLNALQSSISPLEVFDPTSLVKGPLAAIAAAWTRSAAARAITAESSMLARASEAAASAGGRAEEFALGAKHAAGSGGRWAKFAEGVDPNAALREALISPAGRFAPNDATSFRVVTDLGRTIGSRGETGLRAVVDFEGHVVTWFPVRP